MTILCVTTERLPLRRPLRGRWIGGVCNGLAVHLGVSVRLVRLVMALLTAVGGIGPLLYVWFWVTIPVGDPAQAAVDQRPAALNRLAPRLREPGRRVPVTDIAVGVLLLLAAALLIALRQGVDIEYWVLPVLIVLAGTALAWSQLDAIQRGRFLTRAGGRTPVNVVRLLGGAVLAVLGLFLLVGQDDPIDVLLDRKSVV